MRKIIALLFLTLFFLPLASASHGIVIVLEAALQGSPELEAPPVQMVRKGQRIIVHGESFRGSPYQMDYETSSFSNKEFPLEFFDDAEGYYRTLDKRGQTAYIQKIFVKLITKDTREFGKSINMKGHDYMDYRLQEPLPEGYPLFPAKVHRASLAILVGPDLKTSYPYLKRVERESYSAVGGLKMTYTQKVKFDKYDRTHFGLTAMILGSDADFFFEDGGRSSDDRFQFRIGPIMTYDFFRRERHRFNMGGGITLNYLRSFISIQDEFENFDERKFSSLNATPIFTSSYQYRNLLPKTDLIVGIDVLVYLGNKLTSKTEASREGFWDQDRDQLAYPTGGQYNFFFGLQSSY
ncbi:MAG: hypothetical protein HN509_10915 [Halobacteriovoraceae bacterium]|jgi:hypothetical protein|nr:hypothetical protein [Halobacteriovoraceae bacterium]MBT5096100.1 hypothetical protein [Halobacteriovoraceae bacterium]